MPHSTSTLALELHTAMQSFLEGCQSPTLQEQGDEPIPILPGTFSMEPTGHHVSLSVWDESRNWHRRVRAVSQPQRGKLILEVERFGRKPGQAWLFDQARPESQYWSKRGERNLFRDRFRRFAQFAFPSADIVGLSAERDLQRTFSSRFPRAALIDSPQGSNSKSSNKPKRPRPGQPAWAALGVPPEGGAEEALTYGLIWLAHLRAHSPELRWQGLVLFLPHGTPEAHATQKLLASRLRSLQGEKIHFRFFLYDATQNATSPGTRSAAHEADLSDFGNLHTHLLLPGDVGPEGPRPRLTGPEAALEAILRSDISLLDKNLQASPVYGQVSAITGIDRGVADLLAVDQQGRIAVIELKASEDPQLPLQALDYWQRVAYHASNGELTAAGYFPGVRLSSLPPRLLLVAPPSPFIQPPKRYCAISHLMWK